MRARGKRTEAVSLNWTALALGGFEISLESDRSGIINVLRGRYKRFLSAGRGDYRLAVSQGPGHQNPFKPSVLFDGSSLEIRRGDFDAALDIHTGAGTLKAAPNEQCLDAFLRSLLSFLLLRSGGFMLHCAGLVKGGKAYLFLGKSGAGKSTLSKLAAEAGTEVISDEINLLRLEKGSFRVYGSPFWGEMRSDGRPGNWPLAGIYLLKKAKVGKVTPCSKPEALRLLLRCVVNFDKGSGTSEGIMANAARLLGKAKFSHLEFSKNSADFIRLL